MASLFKLLHYPPLTPIATLSSDDYIHASERDAFVAKFVMRAVSITVVILVVLASLSCNDSLPPYIAPTDFLRASIRNVSPAEVYYSYWDTGNDVALTNLSVSTAPQVFFVDIVSTYEETLQGQLEFSGSLELRSTNIPGVVATIPLTVSGITGHQYDPVSRTLTLDPGDTMKVKCSWRYKTDDGRWAFERADVAVQTPGDNFVNLAHVPVKFSASSKVKLFNGTNVVLSTTKEFEILFFGHVYIPVRF